MYQINDVIVMTILELHQNYVDRETYNFEIKYRKAVNEQTKDFTTKEIVKQYYEKMKQVIHDRDYVEGYAEIGLQEENLEIAKSLGLKVEEE